MLHRLQGIRCGENGMIQGVIWENLVWKAGEGRESNIAIRPFWNTEGRLGILRNEVGGNGSGQIRENLGLLWWQLGSL